MIIMLRFEIKKIFLKPLNKIIIGVLLAVTVLGAVLAIKDVQYITNSGEQLTGISAGQHLREDIEKWEEQLTVPDLEHLDWTLVKEEAAKVDRKEKFVGFMCAGGLFERSHHLMGMEEALVNYLEYPDEMAGLLRVIADYKMKYIKMVAEQIHPDIIFYHDDWGSKQNVFLPPRVWRGNKKKKFIFFTLFLEHFT